MPIKKQSCTCFPRDTHKNVPHSTQNLIKNLIDGQTNCPFLTDFGQPRAGMSHHFWSTILLVVGLEKKDLKDHCKS